MQGQLVLLHRRTSKRSAASRNSSNYSFDFTHADLLALRVEYHAPASWNGLNANSRRETIHFRLTADGVQSSYDAVYIDVVDAERTTGSIQDGIVEDHLTETGNRSTLIAAAVTSGLAVTAVMVAVVCIGVTVFCRKRPQWMFRKQSPGSIVSPGEKKPDGMVEGQLPEVVLVSVSNLPEARPPVGVVREPIGIDWSSVDPEILQHCRTTDPILHSEKVWV